jgi:hypothetical protein
MNQKRKSVVVAALLVSIAVALGGCGGGGGKRLTKAEFAKKLNSLCADYQKKINALGTPQSTAEAVKLMTTYKSLFGKIVADTGKLKPPADEQASVDRILAIGRQQLGLIDQMSAALKKNDMAKFQALVKQGDAMDSESKPLFRQIGATVCTK